MAVDKVFGLGVLTFTTELVYDIFLHRKAKSLGGASALPAPICLRPCTHTEWLAGIFSLVPRPSPALAFGRLQYAKTEPEASEDWLSFCIPEQGKA